MISKAGQKRLATLQARKESALRMLKAREETLRVVANGKCPICGARLRANSSIAGWWQCAQFGAEGFRFDSTKPACNWQGFTE